MARAILLCGKLASGKSWYCRSLMEQSPAVLLSVDELAVRLGELGEHHDAVTGILQQYFFDKAVEIAAAGVDVILDWGFWTRASRAEASAFFRQHGVAAQWHYIDVPDRLWRENIARRNAAVLAGQDSSYYVDSGLLEKLESLFQPPEPGEMDVVLRRA